MVIFWDDGSAIMMGRFFDLKMTYIKPSLTPIPPTQPNSQYLFPTPHLRSFLTPTQPPQPRSNARAMPYTHTNPTLYFPFSFPFFSSDRPAHTLTTHSHLERPQPWNVHNQLCNLTNDAPHLLTRPSASYETRPRIVCFSNAKMVFGCANVNVRT
jgi:hypothetical protein